MKHSKYYGIQVSGTLNELPDISGLREVFTADTISHGRAALTQTRFTTLHFGEAVDVGAIEEKLSELGYEIGGSSFSFDPNDEATMDDEPEHIAHLSRVA